MLAKEEAFIARFKARASHAAQVQSRVKKLEKIERVEPPRRRQSVDFEFRPAPRSGDDVVRISGLDKRYGERVVFAGLELWVRRGERWCVMGANGAGKTTLLKLVAGEAAPDAGSVSIGAAVRLGYFAQHSMEVLDGAATVLGTLEHAIPTASVGSLRTLAGCFGFSGDEVEKRCRQLSGGERVRLVLARMLYDPPNFLVLDEPTNHLDLATKEVLIRALRGYEGTLLLVSHDRHFLSALTNRVLELNPGEDPRRYGSGYADYVVASGHEAPGMRS
jgi:ATPase subunit of ABC transporter with duplicated ATPase domains